MNQLTDLAKADPLHNCHYAYFTVRAAAAELQCATSASSPHAGGGDDDDTTCNVTVRWSMRRVPHVAARLQRQIGTDADYFAEDAAGDSAGAAAQPARAASAAAPPSLPFVTEDDDTWRYAVSLKAKGDSTVQYKGFHGGDGYSLCCDALTEATCVWMTAQQGDNDLDCDEEVGEGAALRQSRVLRSCPLPHPAPRQSSPAYTDGFGSLPGARVELTDLDEEEMQEDADGGEKEDGLSGGVFHGVITKPLHRLVEGPWEVVLQFWRRRQQQKRPGHTRAGKAGGIPTDEAVEAEVLGRLIVPFTLNLAELREEGRIAHVPSMALAVEGEIAEEAKNATDASAADADAAADL